MDKPNVPYRDRMTRFTDTHWLIWSNKWGSWYRANSQGYTGDIAQAGIYTREEAERHYDGPSTPRKYQDTEPFPISALKKHVLLRQRNIMDECAKQLSGIGKLLMHLNGVEQ